MSDRTEQVQRGAARCSGVQQGAAGCSERQCGRCSQEVSRWGHRSDRKRVWLTSCCILQLSTGRKSGCKEGRKIRTRSAGAVGILRQRLRGRSEAERWGVSLS